MAPRRERIMEREGRTVLKALLAVVLGASWLFTPCPGASAEEDRAPRPAALFPSLESAPAELSPGPSRASAQAPPAGLPSGAWSRILEQIREARYDISWRERGGESGIPAAWVAPNLAQALEVHFLEDGILVAPRSASGPSWRWGMELEGFGHEGRVRPVASADPIVEGNRLEYRRGPLVEWYVNDRRGLEQGFTVAEAPSPGSAGDRVVLEIRLSGNLSPRVNARGDSMVLRDERGVTRLRYGGLLAFDAEGRDLSARLVLRGAEAGEGRRLLAIVVETAGAVYPLTIDPLFTAEVAKLVADNALMGDELGYSVAISEDTVVVGAPGGDFDGTADTGTAYVFERNAGGWADAWGQVQQLATAVQAGDEFGFSVAINGDTVVVGAPGRDGDGTAEAGAAYVFERNGDGTADGWAEVARLIPSDPPADDRFGESVAVSGDTVAVGAPFYDGDWDAWDSGAVYVFERNGGGGADSWGEVRKLTASDFADKDEFGHSVAMSGDTIVVGAHRDDHAGGDFAGSAYVFHRNLGGADAWGEVRKLIGSDTSSGNKFGGSVAISGDTVVVGAESATGWYNHSGSAYLFERNEGGAVGWGQVKEIYAANGDTGDRFGISVAISIDTVIVGASREDVGGYNTGSAYVFERNEGGAENWGQVQRLNASDREEEDRFGFAVAVSGDTTVVGSPLDDDDGSESGSAYVFVRTGCGWSEQGQFTDPSPESHDDFGYAVAISGDTVVVGDYKDWIERGVAYVFERNQGGADNWGRVRTLASPNGDADDWFGRSVAISGDTVVVGAPYDDYPEPPEESCGLAYVFERNQGGADSWGVIRTLEPTDLANAVHFGDSVAISGDLAVVGDPEERSVAFDAGAAYVFERNQGGADSWGAVQRLIASDAAGYDRFGKSVSLSGDTVVVGAPANRSAYVFERNWGGVADGWGEVSKLVGSLCATGDRFGISVAIGGDTVVVGADDHDGSGPGSAYLYERNAGGADGWGEVRILTASDARADDEFGRSVDIDVDTVVAGAPFALHAGHDSGAAYVFERNRDGMDAWGEVQKVVSDGAGLWDQFGTSVSLSGDTLVAGAPHVGYATETGTVYIHTYDPESDWYADMDWDGYGDPAAWVSACEQPPDHVADGSDCDDANPNCTTDCTDADEDDYCVTTDCDESNPYCSSDCTDEDSDGYCVTDDCDELNPYCTSDCTDGDSDGYCVTVDCDDSDGSINQGASEICDNLADDDCDGFADELDPDCGGGGPAGRVPDQPGWAGEPLRVSEEPNGDLTLTWEVSCLAGDTDYEVYEGTMGDFASHTQRFCSTGGYTSQTFTPGGGQQYYIVVPRTSSHEGSYGVDSSGIERPQGMASCLPQAIAACE
jgi:hypothetical protein